MMKTTSDSNIKDLSNFGYPISDLFKQSETPSEWEQYILSKEQIEFYQENEYLSGVKILTENQVTHLNDELANLNNISDEFKSLFYHYKNNESEDHEKVLFHAIGGWRAMPMFHDLLWASEYRMATYQLMGGSFKLFHDQLFCKLAKHGGVVAWHQDFSENLT